MRTHLPNRSLTAGDFRLLCEKCQKIEATVHITVVVADTQQMEEHDFCEACFRESDFAKRVSGKTAGWTSYGPTKTLMPADKPGWSADIVDIGKLRYEARKRRRKKP